MGDKCLPWAIKKGDIFLHGEISYSHGLVPAWMAALRGIVLVWRGQGHRFSMMRCVCRVIVWCRLLAM